MATLWERFQAALSAWRNPYQQAATVSNLDPFMDSLDTSDQARLDLYRLFWRYYRGQHKRFLKTSGDRPDDNTILNFCRPIVNRGVAFLFGAGLEWELQTETETPAEQAIAAAWRSPEWKNAFLTDLALNGAICGTAYVMIEPSPTGGVPRLVNLDPGIVFPETDEDDIDGVFAWQLRYRTRAGVIRRIISRTDAGLWEFWTERFERAGRWEEVPETRGVFPYSWSPVFHCKNLPNPNEFYGLSDLEDADLNDAINTMASFVRRTGRLFPHQVLYSYGVKSDQFDTGSLYEMQTPEGYIKSVPVQGAMGESLGAVTQWVNYLHMVTDVPAFDPTIMSLGAQSGFALKVLYGPLLAKTNVKRAHYGQMLIEVNRRLAELAGYGPDNVVSLIWGDPLPANPAEQVTGDQFELESQLASKQTVATRRGLNWESEQERMTNEQAKTADLSQQLLEQARRAFDGGMTDEEMPVMEAGSNGRS